VKAHASLEPLIHQPNDGRVGLGPLQHGARLEATHLVDVKPVRRVKPALAHSMTPRRSVTSTEFSVCSAT